MITKILAALYLAFIIALVCLADQGHLPRPLEFIQRGLPFGDTVGHFLLMGTLSFFANYLLKARTVRILGCPVWLGSLLVFLAVFAEECSQLLFPATRSFSMLDLFGDVTGICFFGWLAQQLCIAQQRPLAPERSSPDA